MTQKRYVGLLSKIILILAIFFVQSVAICISAETSKYGGVKYITVSGGTAGDYLIVAAKVAEIISKELPGITTTSIPGGAGINIIKAQRGEIQVGVVYSIVFYQGYHGLGDFKEKQTKVRTLMNLWPAYFQTVVPRDSDITSISDLVKKPYNVWISAVGQGSQVCILETLKAYDITPEKIVEIGGNVVQTNMTDAGRMLQDRQLDFFQTPSSLPYSQIIEVNFSPGVKFLPIDGEAREKLITSLPGLFNAVIPANTYEGQDKDIQTVGFFHQLICSSDLPDDLVYDITAAIVDHLDEIKELSAGLKTIMYDNLARNLVVPLHPGAEKYYIEHNMLKK